MRCGNNISSYGGAMVSDFLTQLLNVTLLKPHKNIIMGLDEELSSYYKERYENAKVVYQKHIGV